MIRLPDHGVTHRVVGSRRGDGAVGQDAGPFRILFVCTGNVHRSAAAELMTRTALERLIGPGQRCVQVGSAGTWGSAGDEPDHSTVPSLIAFGVPADSVHSFRARQLTGAQVAESDLILVAEAGHRRAVWQLDIRARHRTFTILEFIGLLAELPAPSAGPADARHIPGSEGRDVAERARDLVAGAGAVREPRRAADRDYDAAVPGIADPDGDTPEAVAEAINRIADALQPLWLALAGAHHLAWPPTARGHCAR